MADINSTYIKLPYSRVIEPQNNQYPHDSLHIFKENSNTNNPNLKMLHSIESNHHKVKVINLLPINIPCQKTNEVLNQVQSETV